MSSRAHPLPANIGRFRVDALLGSGGMGEVYKAFDPTLQRIVAVKTVRPDIGRPEYLQRLQREAQAGARLTHPNIVTVYEAGEIDGTVYIAMEFLKGEDLAALLQRGELPFETQIRILIQVLDALAHAHANGVIHRDIKPSNVYQQSDGSVKLVDFGLARVIQAETMTLTGEVMGTPDYASPEQLKGLDIDLRSDIYSTGVLAYRMISGRRPFGRDNDSVATIVLRVISEAPPPMDVLWTRNFPEVERIVSRAMAKSPADRYQSAEEMREALTAFLASAREAIVSAPTAILPAEGNATAPGPVTPRAGVVTDLAATARSRTALRTGAAATAIVAGAVVLGLWLKNPKESSGIINAPPPPAANQSTGATAAAVPATQTVAGAPATLTSPTPPRGRELPPVPGVSRAANTAVDAVKTGDPRVAVLSAPLPALVTAKQLFLNDGKAGASAAGLRYRLIQQSPGGAEVDVDPSREFQSGDGVRFAFESNMDGYLYVAQLGTSGRWTVLFPNAEINGGSNAVKRFEQYRVPNDGWFRFDANPGVEQVFVFLSREPLAQLPGFNRLVTKLETVTGSVVEQLQQQIRSRDLVFQKDKSNTPDGQAGMVSYVVNRDELGKAVTASIRLKHVGVRQ